MQKELKSAEQILDEDGKCMDRVSQPTHGQGQHNGEFSKATCPEDFQYVGDGVL